MVFSISIETWRLIVVCAYCSAARLKLLVNTAASEMVSAASASSISALLFRFKLKSPPNTSVYAVKSRRIILLCGGNPFDSEYLFWIAATVKNAHMYFPENKRNLHKQNNGSEPDQ